MAILAAAFADVVAHVADVGTADEADVHAHHTSACVCGSVCVRTYTSVLDSVFDFFIMPAARSDSACTAFDVWARALFAVAGALRLCAGECAAKSYTRISEPLCAAVDKYAAGFKCIIVCNGQNSAALPT